MKPMLSSVPKLRSIVIILQKHTQENSPILKVGPKAVAPLKSHFSDHFTPLYPFIFAPSSFLPFPTCTLSLALLFSLIPPSSFSIFTIWHNGKRRKTNEAEISAEEMELIRQRQAEPPQPQRRRRRRVLLQIGPPRRLRRQVPPPLPGLLRRPRQPRLPGTRGAVPRRLQPPRRHHQCGMRGCPLRTLALDARKRRPTTRVSQRTRGLLRLLSQMLMQH